MAGGAEQSTKANKRVERSGAHGEEERGAAAVGVGSVRTALFCVDHPPCPVEPGISVAVAAARGRAALGYYLA